MNATVKKTVSLLLALLMALSLSPAVLAAGDSPAEESLTEAPAEELLAEEPAEDAAGKAEEAEAPEEEPAEEAEAAEESDTEETEPEEASVTEEEPAGEESAQEAESSDSEDLSNELVAAPAAADAISAAAFLNEQVMVRPWSDGDSQSGQKLTINYYTPKGTVLLGTESVTKGYAPAAAVGPFRKENLIIGWTTRTTQDWSDESFRQSIVFPFYEPATENTDYYAVYAPSTSGNAAFYLNAASFGGTGFVLIDWAATEPGGTLEAKDVPSYNIYSIPDGLGGSHYLYLSLNWYRDEAMTEAADPKTDTIDTQTLYYGNMLFEAYAMIFQDGNGSQLEFFPLEAGKTIAAYPGDKTMPAGEFWQDDQGNIYSADEVKTLPALRDTVFTPYEGATVTYLDTDGKTVLATETALHPSQAPARTAGGKSITNWLDASGRFVTLDSLTVVEDLSLTAWCSPGLSSDEHIRYINGYGDALFAPQGFLTRAEAAKIIYSLLADSSKGPYAADFPDVSKDAWYYDAVTTLASHKILQGDGGRFWPNDNITRAEFITILSRLFPLESGSGSFTDVSEDAWYCSTVASAVDKGWVTGYKNEDGGYSFRPGNNITRAEAVTIVNRVLGRSADKTAIDEAGELLFTDLSPSHWAFYNIMEASVSHGHSLKDGSESWTDFTLPACGLSAGLNSRDGKLFYVEKSGTLRRFAPGPATLPEGIYYAAEDGAALEALSTGIHELDGKLYFVQEDFSLRTAGEDALFEHEGHMYYIKDDHSLACDESIGRLRFGSSGAYTSGSEDLDALMAEFLEDILADDSLSREEKLKKAYDKLVDENLFTSAATDPGQTELTVAKCALRMLRSGEGDSMHWASVMVSLARRLGYDAYRQDGTIYDGDRAHSWAAIKDGDVKYILDPEMEWGCLYGKYLGDESREYDLFLLSAEDAAKLDWGPYKAE